MTNLNKVLIDLYIENQKQLRRAISRAGGMDTVVESEAWEEVLFVLTTNNIAIEATYRGEQK